MAAHLAGEGWLVAFALHREAAPFRRQFPAAPFVVTGIGAPGIDKVLAERRPAGVIAAGFAGALRPNLLVGDVIIANSIVEAASANRFTPVQPHATNDSGTNVGRLLGVEQVIADPRSKRGLGVRWSADACDMESAVIARACTDADIPFACIRVISDEIDMALSPALASCLEGGRIRPASVLRCLMSNTREMWRLARDTRLAAERLAAVLPAVVKGLDQRRPACT